MAHSHGHYQEKLIPCNGGLFIGLLCVLMAEQLTSPRLSDPRDSRRGRCHNFRYDLASYTITSVIFYRSHRPTMRGAVWERSVQWWKYQKMRSLGTTLESGHHRNSEVYFITMRLDFHYRIYGSVTFK